MGTNNGNEHRIKSMEKTFDIIESLQISDGATVTGLANELGYSKSTVHEHLTTLEGNGYVVKGEKGYQLGLKFLDRGMAAKANYRVDHVAKEEIEKAARETGEVVWIIVEEHDLGIYLCSAMGENAITTTGRIGTCRPLHSFAGGKAILAELPPERVDHIIDRRGLPGLTAQTITDEGALREELEMIKEQGVAFNKQETTRGIRAVACPIVVESTVQGSVSVAGPVNRFKGTRFQETIPDIVMGVANAIELKLEYT